MSHLVRLGILLFLSVAGLFGGPLLFRLGKRGRALGAMVDGLALGAVPLVVLLRLLPHAWASIGFWAVVACACGFIGLYLFDLRSHRAAERVGPALILPVLVLHSLADGAALSTSLRGATGSSFGPLLVALLTHRLPEGLFVAAAFVPLVGWAGTVKRVFILAAATVVGALLGEGLLRIIPEAAIDGVVAVGLGGMLHLAVHNHGPRQPEEENDSALTLALAGAAFLAGIAGALWLPAPDDILGIAQPNELTARQSLLPLFMTTAPSLLLALALGVVLDRRRGLATSAIQTVVIVLAPLGAWVAATLLSLRMLGPTLTGLRVAGTATVGVVAAVLAWVARDRAVPPARWSTLAPRPAFWRGLDSLGARFLLGLGAVAALEAALGSASRIPVGVQAPVAVLCGLLLATEPVSATLFVAVLVHKGLPVGPSLAAAAAAILAPSTWSHLRLQLGMRSAVVFGVAVGVLACIWGAVAHTANGLPELHPLLVHARQPFEYAATAALAVLLIVSVLRLGPRGWLQRAFG